MKSSINYLLASVFVWLGFAAHLPAQTVRYSFMDPYLEKEVYLDSLSIEQLLRQANRFYGWKYGLSDTIYDYIIAKHPFALDTLDAAPIGEYGTYMDLAHLRIRKHKYKEARIFLRLADKAEQPKFWCGNAAMAIFERKDAYELLCTLILGPSSASSKSLDRLFTLAVDNYYNGSPYYAGEALIHYLRYKYGERGMTQLLNAAKYTIRAKKIKETDEEHIQVDGQLIGKPFRFWVYDYEEISDDPATVKKVALDFFNGVLQNWRNS